MKEYLIEILYILNYEDFNHGRAKSSQKLKT
jgi:hypothetical protein